jgi:hypothetical protein
MLSSNANKKESSRRQFQQTKKKFKIMFSSNPSKKETSRRQAQQTKMKFEIMFSKQRRNLK